MHKPKLFFIVSLLAIGLITLLMARQAPMPYISFAVTENEPAFASTPVTQSLRLAVSSSLSPRESLPHYRKIADHLSWELHRPVVLIQRPTYSEVYSLLVNGGADIAFFSTGTYILLAGQGEIQPLVMQQRQGSLYYEAYLVVHRDSQAKTLADLRGKTFAFCDPLSYSGYIALVELLREQGQTPENFFGHYFYTYNHAKSLTAVANKVVDGSAIDSLVYQHSLLKKPELAEATQVIGVLGKAGTGPIVVRKSLEPYQQQQLKNAFLNMHTNSQTQAALTGLMIERFAPFDSALFSQTGSPAAGVLP